MPTEIVIASDSGPIPPASKATQLPGELMEFILDHLCARDSSGFDRELGVCSLVCRHWAANIRPVIFADVCLKSQLDAKRFSTAVSSPCKVPAPFNILVRELTLDIDQDARPWMYFVWAPIRDGLLPNLQRIVLTVRTRKSDLRTSQPSRCGCISLCDPGLPRTMPFQTFRPFRLRQLMIYRMVFPSPTALARYLTSVNSDVIRCYGLNWPNGDAALEQAALHSLSRGPFVPILVYAQGCTAVVPFVWTMVTTRLPSPHAPQQRVYISPEQIDAVTGILALFTDDSKAWLQHSAREYRLEVRPGEADEGMSMVVLRDDAYGKTYAIIVQVQPGGSVGRIGVVLDPNRRVLQPLFLSEQTATLIDGTGPATSDLSPAMPTQTLAPPDPPTATSESTALKDMFACLDVLCNKLGDTLLEVVIALGKSDEGPDARDRVEAQENAKLRDVLQGSMPCMVERRCLVVCRHKDTYFAHRLVENVFERNPQNWKGIKLDN